MPKPRKCKVKGCDNTFEPFNSLQKWCSVECGVKLAREAQHKAQRAQEKAYNRETRKRKERLKGRSEWLKEVQALCNKLARLRDVNDGCISCDKPAAWKGQWHGSHYRPAGNNSRLRFHPFNINKACSECNNHKSGNLIAYREKLIKKIGLDNVEWLESQNKPYTWEIEDLKEMKKYFMEQIKLLQ